jgi:hypothetical protein
LGRIQVLNAQFGQSLSANTENPLTGIRESFSINVGSGQGTVHYELVTPELQWVVDFRGSDWLKIEKTPRTAEGGIPVRLFQPRRGPIELTVGRGVDSRQIRADSFWHLMLGHREMCDLHLLPVLSSLRTDWELGEKADEIEHDLISRAAQGKLPDTRRWQALVRQMGRGTFHERRAAERELRQCGQAAVAYLTSLDPRDLDSEQRERIRRIVGRLVAHTDDSPHRVAVWLIGDEKVWLTIQSREDAVARCVATAHLARLRGKPVEFGPNSESETGAVFTAGRPGQVPPR